MAKKMTEQEKEEWNALGLYVKKEILKYGDDKKFPKMLALRLKGLHEGKFCANNNTKPHADYSFGLILTTFKYCKFDISKAMNSNIFKDESHMINYIMLLVESNINTVYDKLETKKRIETKIENVEINEGSRLKYKKKSKEITNKKLKDLI